ncbi:hypothetical protein TVAG_032250 [Trichomonas vaginalis G3]|uniref:Uncharacterized protein n=1 Tax=Trichomonas vaginalis (strain ATCC PRA-98 / G3) TaxID=412133 RepID=A2FIG0_TRIV3|nr:hypothetical protein TVAGG3_0853250 [Trichomonas vaginalis G3]EAX95322.1 hypothetical protein TVAG_032250 [Trichomonas vaginalis G3]KAI5500149.1 hypothetical protein TVAGG3_0853250 [Trichomonas vaginalis G3]|eukprot:XP_001308252.1 hypothetical protein [Trichomonas vaginalis G3]
MGCSSSKSSEPKQSSNTRFTSTKAPIKLFYLPGNVKFTLTKLVSQGTNGNDPNATSSSSINVNARFIDIPNSRALRKLWGKEVTNKSSDCAMSIFLADIRERPMMLLNIKTLNWFAKQLTQKGQLVSVLICNNELEVSEFKSHISSTDIDSIIIKKSDPESIIQFTEIISAEITKYNERKKKFIEVSPRSR